MAKITGIGGIFFKSNNLEDMQAWYKEKLGFNMEDGTVSFPRRGNDNPDQHGKTVWSIFPQNTEYFNPGGSSFMVNYIVDNLDEFIKVIEQRGIKLSGSIEEYDYGRFAWIQDPDGNKIELWEPKYDKN